jgi:acetyl-CoA carboxylase biotin carboxyl carrier protein
MNSASSHYALRADTQGTVVSVSVSPGARIAVADVLLHVEIMKMQIPIETPVAGRVVMVHVRTGDFVNEGDLLLTIEIDPGGSL